MFPPSSKKTEHWHSIPGVKKTPKFGVFLVFDKMAIFRKKKNPNHWGLFYFGKKFGNSEAAIG